jgi:hypothetical protein
MTRAIIEGLYGTAPFSNADRTFAENVYAQWRGSDELLKDVPSDELACWSVISGSLECIRDMHDSHVALFEQAEKAMAPILEAQQEIHMRMAVLGAGVPSTHFFSKPNLPGAYKHHIVSILRKVPELGELELLDDDEGEEASDSDEDESDESEQPDDSEDGDDGEGEEEEGEDQDENEEEEDENEETSEEEDDSESEEEEEAPKKKKKTKSLASKFVLGEAKEPAQASDEEDEEEESEEDEEEEEESSEEEEEDEEESEEDEEEEDEEEEAPRQKKARSE